MHLRRFLPLTALAVLLAVSRAAGAPQTFVVTGIVRAPLENGELVIEHDEIPGYMPAMTMSFTVARPAEAAPLRPGDRIRFRYDVTDTTSTTREFQVVGREAPAMAAAAPAGPSRRLREGDLVPEFSLRDESDRPLTAADLRGRLTLVTFIFTRCPVPEYCPAMAARYGQLQKAIRADAALSARARLLSVTLDPEFDQPEILRAYGSAVGAAPAIWRFATGTKEQIAALTKAFAVYNERNGVTLDHTLCTALIGPDGRVLEIWRGHAWRNEEVLARLAAHPATAAAPAPSPKAASQG